MKKAFTLIELAIVLVIVGLLLGGGMGIFSMLVKRSKVIEAKDNLKSNIEAVTSFATNNDRLPNQDEFKNVAKSLKDSWGKEFIYFPDSNLLNSDSVCERKTTGLTIKICSDSACSSAQEIQNIAFVILSGGGNYNVQTANNSGVIKVYEPGIKVDDNSSDFSRVEEYDDIVDWITLNELRIKAGCQGPQLKIVNNELPYGYENSSYSATIYADGGVKFSSGGDYKWCYEGSFPSGLNVNPSFNSSDCLADDESLWGQADNFTISGTPTSSGTYNIKVYVRDDNDQNGNSDNIASKSFVITINPQTANNSNNNAPPGSQISFANNLSDFDTAGNNNAIEVDSQNGTINLGNGAGGPTGRACFWYPSIQELNGKTMRAYFEFNYKSGTGDGFTFALMRGSNSTDVCGGAGHTLGYGRRGVWSSEFIPGSAVAVEFDTYRNSYWGDPNYNHIAVVRDVVSYAQNKHNSSNTPDCNNDQGDGIYPCEEKKGNWLEDGNLYKVRVEIHTGCNDSCSNCNQNGNNAFLKMWIWSENEDCQNCNDLSADYIAKTENINHCFELPSDLYNVKFGFTEGTWGVTQEVIVSNFGIGFF